MRAVISFFIAFFYVSLLHGNGHFQNVYYPGKVSKDTGRFHWMPAGDNISVMEKEKWAQIDGFEGLYEISTHGRVRSLTRSVKYVGFYGSGGKFKKKIIKERIRKPSKTPNGYMMYCLNKEGKKYNQLAHRLVAKAFCKNPNNKKCVNHKDFCKKNNYYKNLEWVTQKENVNHAHKSGKFRAGERNHLSKLNITDVIKIRKLNKEGYSDIDIQRIISKVKINAIRLVINRKTWKHVK